MTEGQESRSSFLKFLNFCLISLAQTDFYLLLKLATTFSALGENVHISAMRTHRHFETLELSSFLSSLDSVWLIFGSSCSVWQESTKISWMCFSFQSNGEILVCEFSGTWRQRVFGYITYIAQNKVTKASISKLFCTFSHICKKQ